MSAMIYNIPVVSIDTRTVDRSRKFDILNYIERIEAFAYITRQCDKIYGELKRAYFNYKKFGHALDRPRVNSLCVRAEREIAIIGQLDSIRHFMLRAADGEYIFYLKSGTGGARVIIHKHAGLITYMANSDKLTTIVDGMPDYSFREVVGGMSPNLLDKYYSGPARDVVKLIAGQGGLGHKVGHKHTVSNYIMSH